MDIVKALLEVDSQLARRTDKKGQTALHMAVKGVSCEVVKLLLEADAAVVMLPDKFGNTALHVATRKKRVEVYFGGASCFLNDILIISCIDGAIMQVQLMFFHKFLFCHPTRGGLKFSN